MFKKMAMKLKLRGIQKAGGFNKEQMATIKKKLEKDAGN